MDLQSQVIIISTICAFSAVVMAVVGVRLYGAK